MAALIWNHGKTRDEVRRWIQSRLQADGINDKVSWNGDVFSANVGWGTILNLVGEITDQAIILHKASGALGGVVVTKSRDAFQQHFPGGEQLADQGNRLTGVQETAHPAAPHHH